MTRCDRKDCPNEATMFPVIVLVGKNHLSKADFQLGLNLCQEHCLPDKKEYIAAEGWDGIDKAFKIMYKIEPDHEASYMDFRPLEDRMPNLQKR